MSNFDPAFSSIVEISKGLNDRNTTSAEITEAIFSRIERLDPHLKAFVCLTEDRAIEEARKADERHLSGGAKGPLDGVPYAVKDIFDVRDQATMAGTRLLSGNVADDDCYAVKRLSEAGMVLIGKTHTVQFAATINGINPDFGTPHNPWQKIHHLPGGSSSGSAVAVASGMVPVSLGSDTAGSIRVPAALTGITGFKPTRGRLGRGGVWPLSWNFDTIGPLTRSAQDAAMIFDALQGRDPKDETTWGTSAISSLETIDDSIEGLHIIVCDSVFFDDCDPQVTDAVEKVIDTYSGLGADVTRATITEIEEAFLQVQKGIIIDTEAYAENQRFLECHRDELDPDCLWMEYGKSVTGSEYYNALSEQRKLRSRFSNRLTGVDAVLGPTTAFPAWPVAETIAGDGPPVPYTRNTALGNYLNLSSISFPCGLTDGKLPVGAMICAPPGNDEIVLRIANSYQKFSKWHQQIPSVPWIRSF